ALFRLSDLRGSQHIRATKRAPQPDFDVQISIRTKRCGQGAPRNCEADSVPARSIVEPARGQISEGRGPRYTEEAEVRAYGRKEETPCHADGTKPWKATATARSLGFSSA